MNSPFFSEKEAKTDNSMKRKSGSFQLESSRAILRGEFLFLKLYNSELACFRL